MARCRPRSPTGSTLGRIMWKMRNISTLQRPMPFTWMRSSMIDSSSIFVQRRGEILHVGDLAAGEAARANRLGRKRHDVARGHVAGARRESVPDRLRRLDRD